MQQPCDNRRKSSAIGLLSRLRKDRSGNVLAITAASVIPILGVVGGAVDASRLYLTKSRIQAACDSGVLAGRKAMSTNVYTAAARTRAESMFAFNFQDTDYGTTGTTFTSSADAQGKLSGTANTTVPMALMQIFGITSKPLGVKCSADIQVPNIDIVMVLDVTGSMGDPIGGVDKINSMKAAAKDFYDTLAAELVGNTQSQIRYGFVPYSQAVNVSELFRATPDATKGELPLTHLANTMQVESRVANFTTPVTDDWAPDPNTPTIVFEQVFNRNQVDTYAPFVAYDGASTPMSTFDCEQYASNRAFNIGGINLDVTMFPRTSYPGQGNGDSILYRAEGSTNWTNSRPSTGTFYDQLSFARVSGTWSDSGGSNTGAYRTCERRVTQQRYTKQTGFAFTNWTYRPVSYDVSAFKGGNTLQYISSFDSDYTVTTSGSYDPVQLRALADQSGLNSSSTTWDGCVEERDTTAVANFAPIPSAAKDLNWIDGGTTDDTWRWRPVLRELTHDRQRVAERTTTSYYGKPGYTCPGASVRNLNVMTESEFDTYIDSLTPGGFTYLDMGMVWGLRLISPQGMFASRNLVGPNGGQISRHVIFLTDGSPVSASDTYSSYGVERMAERITGATGENAATLHARRFQALCDAQRGVVSVWAIAFGTSVSGNLSNCADPGRAYQANNATELQNAFRNIARDVADLRLVE